VGGFVFFSTRFESVYYVVCIYFTCYRH